MATHACELGNPLFQQGELTHRIICGLVHYEEELKHPLIQSLPSILHFSQIAISDPIWTIVELIDKEMQDDRYSLQIVNRLTEVLFLQLLKKYVADNNVFNGFFSALSNPKLYQAFELIHQNPQYALSLLGEKIGMSNATLTRHFNKMVGFSPMTYLSNWRMFRAYHLLKYSNFTLEAIAELVGFSSARTLNKAFVRYYGYTPKSLRNNTRDVVK